MLNQIKPLLILLLFWINWQGSYAQSVTVSGNYQDEDISSVLNDIATKANVNINYPEDLIYGLKYTGNFENETLGRAVRQVIFGLGIAFLVHDGEYYIIKSSTVSMPLARIVGINLSEEELAKRTDASSDDIIEQMGEIKKFTVTGVITDGKTQQPMAGVIVSDVSSKQSVATGLDGRYTLTLDAGKHVLQFSGMGYESTTSDIILSKDVANNIQMFEKSVVMDELVISANNLDEKVSNVQSSVEIMNIETIKELPTFLGEIDVIKNLLTLPGVTNVGEGAAGFNVRGGKTDENLILMDGMPIFNSSHMFGFFSVFNGDVVDNFALYKGGIPARYGGRTSSILEVTTKKGDPNTVRFSGSIGTVSSKAKIEVPIIKERSSLAIGYRQAYPDWILNQFPDDDIKESSANFYDINAKFNYKLKNNSELLISTYNSLDDFEFAQDTVYNWQNFGITTDFIKPIDDRNSIKFKLVYSDYQNNIIGHKPNSEFTYNTSIEYMSFGTDFIRSLNENDILEFGLQANLYDVNPGKINPTDPGSSINDFALDNDKSIETGIFASYDKTFSPRLSGQFGLRMSYYSSIGPGKYFDYENPELPQSDDVLDSTLVDGGLYGGVLGIEPRLNLKYQIDQQSSIKFGYNLMRQNIHQVSVTSAVAPGDYWKLSNPNISPTISNQFNLGYYRLFNDYAVSVETYYKRLENLVDYRDGAEIFLNPTVETAIVNTTGRSYGVEFKLEKKGRLNGWLSYTLSKTERKSLASESSKAYIPTGYDKPHNLNITANYKMSRRVSVSGNFALSSGRPITVPESGYFYNDRLIVNYSERNSNRVPTFHRLDLSIVLKSNLKKDQTYKGSWAFSIYNVYGRRNPYSVYFDTVGEGRIPQGYKLSILGTAFPAISYSFRIQ